jgi:hypothetical protein
VVAAAALATTIPAMASSGGVSNGNLQSSACSAHGVTGSNTVTLAASKSNPAPGEQITITATVSGSQGTQDKMGVMLTTATSGNSGTLPTEKGWTIVSDPAGTKYNYVEKSGYSGSMTFTWTVKAPASTGSYTLYAKAFYGTQRYVKVSGALTTTVTAAAVNPPTVSITSPANGATVSGTVSVTVSAAPDTGQTIANVDLKIDGTSLGVKTSSPYTWSLNTASYSNAAHTLTATALDGGGRSASQQISVTISNAVPAPTVSITSPGNGATLTGNVSITASVSAQAAVTSVELKVDSTVVGTDSSSPYSFTLNTFTLSKGSHTLTVTATDANAKTGSASITITVNNDPTTVSISSPANGSTVSGTMTASAAAFAAYGRTIQSVTLNVDGTSQGADSAAPYSWSVNTLLLSNGVHRLQVVALDSGGATASAEVSVTVNNQGLTASFTNPVEGASLSGTVAVSAAASSGAGISSVVLRLDGVELGSKTASPYSWQIDTSAYADGGHVLNVTATDALGRKAYAQVQVTFVNSGPQVSIASPADGASVSGTVSVTATVTSANAVSYVQFLIDGSVVGNRTSSPYSWTFSTNSMAAGQHSLSVKAVDLNGRAGQRTIQIIVANPLPTVSITSPADGAVISGTVSVSGSASSAQGISYVEFYVDGVKLGNRTAAPFAWTLATTTLTDGQHLLEFKAVSSAGLSSTAQVSVIVQNTNSAAIPAVTVTIPSGKTLNGTFSVTSSITSADPLLYVTLRVDEELIDMRSGPPYSWSIDSNLLSDGQHVIIVTAVTTKGGMGVKSASITISNPVPRLSLQGIAEGSAVSGAVSVSLTAASANQISEMYIWLDGRLSALFSAGSGSFMVDSNSLSNGQHQLDALAKDVYGKEGRMQLFFLARNDAPMVSLLAPADGSRHYGAMDIKVEVVCSRATQVTLKVDDLIMGTAATPPYSFRIDSNLLSDGTHIITATAVDSYGKSGQAQVTVIVNNSAPTIALATPAQGSIVSGAILLEPVVNAPNGVESLALKLDGIAVSEDATAPYQYLLDSNLMSDGIHLLEWRLIDRNGRSAEFSVSFQVLNLPPAVAIAGGEGKLHGIVEIIATISGGSPPLTAWAEVDGVFLAPITNGTFSLDTEQLGDGEHLLNVTAEDAYGRRGHAEVTISVANAGPVVSILTPTANGELRRNATVSLQVDGQWPVDVLRIYVDDILIGELRQAPWSCPLVIGLFDDGMHALKVRAWDSLGGTGEAAISFSTLTVRPQLALAEPSGTTGTVEVAINSNVPLAYVVYSLDGAEVSNVSAAPYSLILDTSAYADGMHSLNATAVLDDGTPIELTKRMQISAAKAPGASLALDFKDLDLIFLQVMFIVLLLAVVLGKARGKKKGG